MIKNYTLKTFKVRKNIRNGNWRYFFFFKKSGIRNKFDYIKDNFLDFNILCFTETHLDHQISTSDLFLSNSFDEPYRTGWRTSIVPECRTCAHPQTRSRNLF